jgi:hypothetical protein
MNQTDPSQTLLAVNSTEWLNLCARGSIRMSKRRPITVSTPVSEREMEKVFASAPFTKHESSVDLFILEIDHEWSKSKSKHRVHPSEILILTLSDVITHRPVSQEHLEYYRNIGSKCNVELDEPIFEKFWIHWITNETIQSSLDAAHRLQSILHIETSMNTKGPDKYKWEDIARLVLRPHEEIKSKPASIEIFLHNIRAVADAVASTRDTEQFFLACAIEWIHLRLKKDPLKKKADGVLLRAAKSNAKELPLGSPTDQTNEALQYLVESFPKAFNDPLSPMTIAHVVQLLTEARTRRLAPETFIRIINSHDSKSASATLLTFVLATSLGIEFTNQLILALAQIDKAPMNWDLPT